MQDETGVSNLTESDTEGEGEAAPPPEDSRLREGLARARQLLDQGEPDVAVETAYAAFKEYLARIHDIDRSLPHWEFLTAYEEAATGSTDDVYRRFTELYERAAFSPDRVSTSSADKGVHLVESVLDDEDSAGPSHASGTSDSS
jgi:hypothetical protein